MTYTVRSVPDEEWAAIVAAHFHERVAPGMRICLPTGNTTTPFYAEVARHTSLEGVEVFLLDEFGGLPDDDPGRCMSMLTRDLLSRVEGKPRVHAPDVDASDPEHAADRYGDLITEGGLDLALVGLGANGHIGMNEPGATVDLATRVVQLEPSTTKHAAEYGATTPPTWGITVGMAELMEAGEVWVLVTGDHKADILNRMIHGKVDSDIPATYLTEHTNCTVFADRSALGA
ncbi:MAG: 6-phosphogluconolactonase [Actinomycetota bacterium]